MNPASPYIQITHTFERVIEEFKSQLIKAELIYAKLGVCEVYHYSHEKTCEEVLVVYTGDNRIVVKVILNNENCDQIRYIFNNKGFFSSVEVENQTTFSREVENEFEVHEMLKRFLM